MQGFKLFSEREESSELGCKIALFNAKFYATDHFA